MKIHDSGDGKQVGPDIVEQIVGDHRRILRLQAALRDAARCDHDTGPGRTLASVWDRLTELIEAHIQAMEEICYLAIFEASPAGRAQMDAAIADHGDIRVAFRQARLQPTGSAGWWRAAHPALAIWAEQTDREELDVLADFARRAGHVERGKLDRQWSALTTARSREADVTEAT